MPHHARTLVTHSNRSIIVVIHWSSIIRFAIAFEMSSYRSIIIVVSIYVFFFGLCGNIIVFADETPIVQVQNGTLEGIIMKSRKGRELLAFMGIPYAQPPLGKLRFEPPKPYDAWTGVRSAKKHGNNCIQRDILSIDTIIGLEDCLYLNVYRPKSPLNGTDSFRTTYPVLIYIHGGAWVEGSGDSQLWGPKYLLDHDIILVTINYRLGPLGFLSTEDSVVPGNQGLKDMIQAVRWVNENIAAFSGDPNRITIAGQSAGAASAHYFLISPASKGLFHRAISQGGSVLNPWAIYKPGIAKKYANKLGQLLDCPTNSTSALVECLKERDSEDIIATDRSFQVFGTCPLVPFRPVIEADHPGAVIKDEPEQSLRSANMADVPWMTGINIHDGSFKVEEIFSSKDQQYDKILDAKFMEIAPITLLYGHTCPDKLKDNMTKSIREFYFGNERIDESTKWSLIDLYTDAWFVAGIDNSIRHHLEALSSPVYFNVFAYKGTFSFCGGLNKERGDYGVAHGDDLYYIFPLSETMFPAKSPSKQDEDMIDIMTGLWANFVKSGNPTSKKTPTAPPKWKPVRTSKLEYLYIGNPKDIYMADDIFPDRVNFWANLSYRNNIITNKSDHHIKDEL